VCDPSRRSGLQGSHRTETTRTFLGNLECKGCCIQRPKGRFGVLSGSSVLPLYSAPSPTESPHRPAPSAAAMTPWGTEPTGCGLYCGLVLMRAGGIRSYPTSAPTSPENEVNLRGCPIFFGRPILSAQPFFLSIPVDEHNPRCQSHAPRGSWEPPDTASTTRQERLTLRGQHRAFVSLHSV